MSLSLAIECRWDGRPIDASERVGLALERCDRGLTIAIDAPFHGDPAPATPPGRCERLWEFEVVELFLVGEAERYLELEFGPHGHYLALKLAGRRNVTDASFALEYRASIAAGRWRGQALVSRELLPERVSRCNAFAIHGTHPHRRYLAAHPLAGAEPDFHRIDDYPEVERIGLTRDFFFGI